MIKNIYRKIALVIGIIFILLFVFIALLGSVKKDFLLTISPNPKDATVKVSKNGEVVDNTNKLETGSYKIEVIKEGFISDIRDIILNKDIHLEVNLIKQLSNFNLSDKKSSDNIIPLSVLPENTSVEYDTKNKYLIVAKNGKNVFKDIGEYKYLNFSYPLLIYQFKAMQDTIRIINLLNQATANIESSQVSPTIYTTANPVDGTIFLLGNYDPDSRIATLYKKGSDQNEYEKIISTSSNKLEFISQTRLLLIEEIDYQNSNFYKLYDLTNNRIVIDTKGSYYTISPSKEYMAVVSENLINFFDFKNNSKRSISWKAEGKVAWVNDSTLIKIKNSDEGLIYSYIDTIYGAETQSAIIPNTKGIYIREIIGNTQNDIFVRTTSNQILTLSL